jgi:hypothetical protein
MEQRIDRTDTWSANVAVDWSDNGSAWTTAGSFTLAAHNSLMAIPAAAGSHVHWRVRDLEGGNDYWHIYELFFNRAC